ncbi:uncharacterized protein SPAPADRAFT_135115 [Spathaspora passalidarum NRRL Y-27907]|uniref:Uncharacterized protein n=1 Tax=Spathaspora passalidarum (strain NRRL Y-27907 / 11-Y1) TaxID=619300 RepID=G3AHR5_SPAPN|nr:uncharacterized protein SPAPADRAFT_135115 [Spathaspora passalidarum NRRL Y-27907]EGW34229.1 hypothetical protein SPAPADRAFT_135115 [Spathaspora passalidarum NRRL Y-27907]
MTTYPEVRLKHIKSIGFHNLYLSYENSSKQPAATSTQFNGSAVRLSPHRRRNRAGTITSIPEIDTYENNESELVDVSNRRILDCFISIHTVNKNAVVYISEIQNSTINPCFQGITVPDLPNCSKIIIKLWCRPQFPVGDSNTSTPWHLLAVYKVKLGENLIKVGDITDEEIFKPNSIVFEINRSWYTLYNLLKGKGNESAATTVSTTTPVLPHSSHMEALKSYSFDSIRSINNLVRSLVELEHSKHKLIRQINEKVSVLQDSNNVNNVSVLLGKLRIQCQSLSTAIAKQKSVNDSILSEIISTKKRIQDLEEVITYRFASLRETTLNQIELFESEIEPIRVSLEINTYPDILTRLQILAKHIQEIIPIDNISGIQFSIMGFQFPSDIKELLNICYYNTCGLKNSYYQPQFENQTQWHEFKISQINTALSYIVLIINILASITNTQLKYEMVILNNHNVIIDGISQRYPLSKAYSGVKSPYIFPLYYNTNNIEKLTKTSNSINTGNMKYILMNQEFEYAIKLLNKNLVGLITSITKLYNEICPSQTSLGHDIPLDCLDNFLWNLKYLLLFMTAPL